MKPKINKPSLFAYFTSLFLMISVLMGVFSIGSIDAQARNMQQEPPEQQLLKIAQGNQIHHHIPSGQVLEFSLDVMSPTPGASYTWTVEKPANLGEVVIEPSGHSVKVTYYSDPNQGGQDLVDILLTSNTGQQTRVSITIWVELGADYLSPNFFDAQIEKDRESLTYPPSMPGQQDGLARENAPMIRVNPDYDWVSGDFWPAGATVTLSVGSAQWTGTAEEWGWVSFDTWPFNFSPGQVLEMTDGVTTRTHIVADLAVTSIDEVNNIVTGTADPYQAIMVAAENSYKDQYQWFELTADASGSWQADFSGYVDIEEGTYGWVYQYDDEGNYTTVSWRVPNPYISANILQNRVWGGDWSPDAAVTLSIGRYRWSQKSDKSGWVGFSVHPVKIQPGQVLEMTDGIKTRTLIVADLAVTTIDEANDVIRGTADPEHEVQVSAYNRYKDQYDWYTLNADAAGIWQADFSGSVDIEPGTDGWVSQCDQARNCTEMRWFVPDPYIWVSGRTSVSGSDWTPGAQVTFTFGAKTWTKTAGVTGYVWFSFYPDEIQPGQVVRMSDGIDLVEYTMANLSLTTIDQVNDILSGTADHKRVVSVSAYDKFGERGGFEVTADALGNWQADLSIYGVDIGPGSYGWVEQYDEDRNGAWLHWRIPDPWITVYPLEDVVQGSNWTPETTATLTIGTNQWTNTVWEWGYTYFYTYPYDIQAGDVLHMTDGIDTRTHTVANLAITVIDEEQDTISGTGDPNSEVWIWAYDKNYGYADYYLKTDDSGNWFVDFYGRVDIGPGTQVDVTYRDIAGSGTTSIYWYLPDPSIEVNTEHNYIFGRLWPPNVEITLEVDGNQWVSTSSRNGWVYFNTSPFDLLPNQEIIISGGGYELIYQPWAIEITSINYTTDVIEGTAQPPDSNRTASADSIEIEVQACDSGTCASQFIEIVGDGSWEADFSGVIDLKAGTSRGSVKSSDGSAGITVVYWTSYATFLPLIIK